MLTIPAIAAGQYQTTPLEIEVLPSGSATVQPQSQAGAGRLQAGAGGQQANRQQQQPTAANGQTSDFWAELTVASKTPYVGQELNGTIFIYDKKGIQFQNEPYFEDTEDWEIRRVGDAEVSEKNGQRVIKFNYAFFPKKSGRLTLPAARIDGVYLTYEDSPVTNSIGGLFKMFEVNFDMTGLFGVQKPVSLHTKPLSVNVKPIPDNYGNAWWLPATALKLSAKWTDERPVFKVGEAVTREISLIASGVSDNQLPELEINESPAWKQYPEKPHLTTAVYNNELISEAVTRIVYIPQKGGEQVIPEVKLQWFNLKKQQIETAIIPAETMYVGGVVNTVAQPTPAPTPVATGATMPTASELIADKLPAPAATAPNTPMNKALMLLVIIGAFLAGIIFSYLLSRHKTANDKEMSATDNLHLVEKHLKNGDYRALRDSLLEWGQKYYKSEFINNLNELADKVNVPEFKQQMIALNGILYAGRNENLDKEVILKCLKSKRDSGMAKKVSPLPDLYK